MNPVRKRRLLTVKLDSKSYDEFAIASRLRGVSMSAMMTQFVARTIREEKEANPRAFGEPPPPPTRYEIYAETFDGKELQAGDWTEIEAVVKTLVDQRKANREAISRGEKQQPRSNFKRKKT